MIEPLKISRKEFPKSEFRSDGMITLNPCCDNHSMQYIKDIEFINRNGTPLYIQLLLPDDINDVTPLIVFVNGSAFHWRNVEQSIPRLSLLVNKGFAVASVQNHIEPDSPEGYLIGRLNVLERPELTASTVIMNYISKERAISPILIFHGTNDELVPFGQSCMLYDKLKECGKSAEFYAVDGAHHGGREFWSEQVLEIIENFILNPKQ